MLVIDSLQVRLIGVLAIPLRCHWLTKTGVCIKSPLPIVSIVSKIPYETMMESILRI